jgi:hypothetical protein
MRKNPILRMNSYSGSKATSPEAVTVADVSEYKSEWMGPVDRPPVNDVSASVADVSN